MDTGDSVCTYVCMYVCMGFKEGFHVLYGFMGCGFTSRRQESGSVFSVAVCKIQASKHFIESLPFVLKDERILCKYVGFLIFSYLLYFHGYLLFTRPDISMDTGDSVYVCMYGL